MLSWGLGDEETAVAAHGEASSQGPPRMRDEYLMGAWSTVLREGRAESGGAPISRQLPATRGRRSMAGSTARLGRLAQHLQKCR